MEASNGARDPKELLRERRLARMRQGQSVCETVTLPSDPEIRLALVPPMEREYDVALETSAQLVVPDNVSGMMQRNRAYMRELLAFSIRKPYKLEERVFMDGSEISSDVEQGDVDFLIDRFQEITERLSPSLEEITQRDFDELKKALAEINWSALSGRSWYVAKRFISALMQDGLLEDSSLGLRSTRPSTTKSE